YRAAHLQVLKIKCVGFRQGEMVLVTLKQIEYFQMVLAKGNISAAADELFISRSVISRALAELEEEFQTNLFIRSKNGVILTESGKMIACLFKEFSACYALTKERVRQISNNEKPSTLHLGITPTNAYHSFSLYFEDFRKNFPEIRLNVNEYGANDAWKLLLDGTVDAFVTPARTVDHNMFGSINLYRTQIMLGASFECPISEKESLGISDILDLPLGYLNAPMPVEEILNSCFHTFDKIPRVVLRTSDQRLLQELTTRGIIYTILPSDILETWSGVIRIPIDFFPASMHRLVWNKALTHDAVFNSFLEFMQARAIGPKYL
ncbi:MAG TPA: LysR family transcriptional regulator, partial [Clostridia bacterium]|nr:LysR family transcriptional regulator [Clostridia bacterium]